MNCLLSSMPGMAMVLKAASIPPLPRGAAERRGERSEQSLRPPRPRTRSNIFQPEIVGSWDCGSLGRCAGKKQSAPPLPQFERQADLLLADCPLLCTKKFHQDQKARL